MLQGTISVEVSVDKAAGYKFPADQPTRTNDKGERFYVITGKSIMAQPSDFADESSVADLEEALVADFGSLERDSVDGVHKKGASASISFLLNNGGLRLAYGDLAKDQFRTEGSRKPLVVLGEAVNWAVLNAPQLLGALATGGEPAKQKLLEAYAASK